MSTTHDWWDHFDDLVEEDERATARQDAEVEAWLDDGGDDDSGAKPDAKATDSKSAAEAKPEKAPESNVPAKPDFSAVDGAKSLDEAIALVNAAQEAARSKPEPVPTKSPAEVRAAIDEALEGATSLDDAVARLAKAGLTAEKGSQL